MPSRNFLQQPPKRFGLPAALESPIQPAQRVEDRQAQQPERVHPRDVGPARGQGQADQAVEVQMRDIKEQWAAAVHCQNAERRMQ